jgi:hypothetical protein
VEHLNPSQIELNFTQTDQAYHERDDDGMNENTEEEDFDPNYVYEMLNIVDNNQLLL